MADTTKQRIYAAIDLKSYYASVECAARHLDPMTTNLVVADVTRTEKTICLAVSPSLKAYGIPGRARLFDVIQAVEQINAKRLQEAIRQHKAVRVTPDMDIPSYQPFVPTENPRPKPRPQYTFVSSSFDETALAEDPSLELTYIIAPPQMNLYMQRSAQIYDIYLKYIAPEDILVYSIDECFLDLTNYLDMYHMTAHELTMTMIREVLYETGITATGGIGTNMYLAKVAMDIVAKHVPADKDGVRIAELDERSYREKLWAYQPLTKFWRVGPGIAKKLEKHQMFTMGDVARCSIGDPATGFSEKLLYKLFGKNAELLIDHAWGREPVTMDVIKQYKPASNSLSNGQVLHEPYPYDKARLIVREMIELLVLDMVAKGVVTDQIVLYIGYESMSDEQARSYQGELCVNHYGKLAPKPDNGSISLGKYSSSTKLIAEKTMELFEAITNPALMVRRVNLAAVHLIPEKDAVQKTEQLDLFTDYEALEQQRIAEEKQLKQERSLQKAMLDIKSKFGKNAILKGMNLQEGGTTIERNQSVGGHKA